MSRALYIGSPFFGYYEHIVSALEARGYTVDFYNDRPNENGLLKGAIRVRPALVDGVVQRYLDGILRETAGQRYDLILVVNGKVLTPTFLEELRRRNPQAEAVFYLWDSVELYPNVLQLAELFDRRYTFDSADADTHSAFTLLPLFYTNEYRDIGRSAAHAHDFDIANICTAHANRYELMRKLVPELEAEGLRVFSYLYLHPLQFAYNRAMSKSFKGARVGEFRFRPLPPSRNADILRRSHAVLDVNHSAQTGLTMRTIETIGAQRKLITSNRHVVDYPFYDPTRILLMDVGAPSARAIREFLEVPGQPIDPDLLECYSVDHWVGEIIGERDR